MSNSTNLTKKIKLYAYRIEPEKLTTNNSDFTANLISHWESSKESVGSRRLKISQSEQQEDFLSYAIVDKNNGVYFGIVMRVAPGKDMPEIPADFFNKDTFKPGDLTYEEKESIRVVSTNYFLSDAKYIITTYSSIKTFEAYFNWYLQAYGNWGYKFSQLIDTTGNISLQDIKEINFGGSAEFSSGVAISDNDSKTQLLSLSMNKLKEIIGLNDELQVLLDKNVLSANLVVRFAPKKKQMDDDDIKKALSAVVTNMVEDASVKVKTRSGNSIKLGQMRRMKEVEVSLVNGAYDENQLHMEMRRFVKDLKDTLR